MMNYYSHNLGDYAQATSHLTLLEDAVYTRLLRRYYAEEQAFPDDIQQITRWVGARTEEERAAVPVILKEFFRLEGGVWHNKRADEEIAAYRAKADRARANGLNGGRPVKTGSEPTDNPEESGSKTNQEPITNNQEPNKKLTSAAPPEFDETWKAYPSRPGASKADSLKAWKARIKEGCSAAEIHAGVLRYAAHVKAAGTEPQYIKQPKTFFGPGQHFLADWSVGVAPQNERMRTSYDRTGDKELARRLNEAGGVIVPETFAPGDNVDF